MKRRLIVGVLLITLCLLITGCGKKESSENELFDKEFSFVCEKSNQLDDPSPDPDEGPIKAFKTETNTYKVNKEGYVYYSHEKSVYECENDYSYNTLSKSAKDMSANDDDYTASFDDSNRIITFETKRYANFNKLTKEEKESLYVTEFFKSEEDDGYTCSYKGITEEEVLNAK